MHSPAARPGSKAARAFDHPLNRMRERRHRIGKNLLQRIERKKQGSSFAHGEWCRQYTERKPCQHALTGTNRFATSAREKTFPRRRSRAQGHGYWEFLPSPEMSASSPAESSPARHRTSRPRNARARKNIPTSDNGHAYSGLSTNANSGPCLAPPSKTITALSSGKPAGYFG